MTERWTHPSIRKFAPKGDPVEAMVEYTRKVILMARDNGWSGPPFDPFVLASVLKVPVTPRTEVADARTVPEKGALAIEFNPNRPPGRIRFSIAHELAHTFFPDCADQARHRLHRTEMDQSDWQLEMLCNLGASEILMPVGSFPELAGKDLSIDQLMELRKEYDVSAEAILMRVVRLTEVPAIVFAASRIESGSNHGAYRIDYAISSRRAALNIARGLLLPESTVLKECTAIGFTAKGKESWPGVSEELSVEGVGVPPYPDRRFPRVVGLALLPKASARPLETIKYLRGDATEPRGTGPRLIAQIVNDRTPRWGGGFAQVIKKKWPRVQEEFIRWADVTSENLKLGRTHRSEVMDGLAVFSMVSQHGYGESPTPRIRYRALQECLKQLAEDANSLGASVHMPRIGCGEARGSWDVIGELIVETLSRAGITVTVYDLPNAKQEAAKQKLLFQ